MISGIAESEATLCEDTQRRRNFQGTLVAVSEGRNYWEVEIDPVWGCVWNKLLIYPTWHKEVHWAKTFFWNRTLFVHWKHMPVYLAHFLGKSQHWVFVTGLACRQCILSGGVSRKACSYFFAKISDNKAAPCRPVWTSSLITMFSSAAAYQRLPFWPLQKGSGH